jgi:hypothetical protein
MTPLQYKRLLSEETGDLGIGKKWLKWNKSDLILIYASISWAVLPIGRWQCLIRIIRPSATPSTACQVSSQEAGRTLSVTILTCPVRGCGTRVRGMRDP